MVRSLKSPTFWVAFAALVIAMGGSAFAATLINGRSIRKGTIPGDRLGKNTLRGDRVKNGALTGNDLKGNTLTGKQIAESKLGEVPKAKTAGATADSGLLGGMPPAKFQRFTGPAKSPGVPQGNAIPPGYGVAGAYGCASATAHCVVSLPGPAPTKITTVSS